MGEQELRGMLKPRRGKERENKELAKLMRGQLVQLQRQYKLMQSEKLTEAQRMTISLGPQKAILDKMQEDQYNLVRAGEACVSEKDVSRQKALFGRLAAYIQEKAFLEDEIASVKKETKDLDRQNLKLALEIKELETRARAKLERETWGGNTDHVIRMLDNKLSNSMVELNKTMGTCRRLRLEIEELLRERDSFKDLMSTVLNKLTVGKSLMLDMIEQATLAFEKRAEAKARLQALEQRHRTETEVKARQLQEFSHVLKVDIDKAIFFSVKCQRRVMGDLEANKRLTELVDRQLLESNNFRRKLYLFQIKELYNEERLEDAVDKFQDTQVETMSVFVYIINTYCEAQRLHFKNKLLKFVIEQGWKSIEESKTLQLSKLQALQNEYDESKRNAGMWAHRLEYAQSYVKFAMFRLNKIFLKAGCLKESFASRLGDVDVITVNNVDMMLKEVEKHMVGLIAALYRTEKETPKEGLPMGRCILILAKRRAALRPPMDVGTLLETPCPLCTEQERMVMTREVTDSVDPYYKLEVEVKTRASSGALQNHLHTISACMLPGSRRLMQKRFLLVG